MKINHPKKKIYDSIEERSISYKIRKEQLLESYGEKYVF